MSTSRKGNPHMSNERYCIDCKHCIGEPTCFELGYGITQAYSCMSKKGKFGMFMYDEKACEFFEEKKNMEKETPTKVRTAPQVQIHRLLMTISKLKQRSIIINDPEIYELADSLEHEVKLLQMDDTVIEKWKRG